VELECPVLIKELYLLSRNTDNPDLIRYYKKYCKVLIDFIKLAKKLLLPHMQFGTPSNVQAALNYPLKVFKNPFPKINMMPVTNKEIKDIVRSLKWKSSQGYDEIPQHILKLSLSFILSPYV
jgi:hypothetical protein